MCSVCGNVFCEDCKVAKDGKIYCLEHAPKEPAAETKPAETKTEVQPVQAQEQPKPKSSHGTIKTIIYADLTLLIGISLIFFISTTVISGMVSNNFDIIMNNFPQLTFIFTLMQYFNSFGLYAIMTLLIILIVAVAYLVKKRNQ